MNGLRRYTVLGTLLVAMLAVAALVGVLADGRALAQTDTEESEQVAQEVEQPQRVINVTGQGTVSARPDQATVIFGVQTEADSAADALEENNTTMQEVISATLDAGIAENDIQTQQLRLQPVYDEAAGPDGERTLSGYRAINSVSVTVDNIEGVGDLLDAAVAAGANTIDNIRFEISERDQLIADAREAAVNDAQAKAEQLADLTGAELGEVLTISEAGGAPPEPFFAEDTAAVGGAVPPIEPGSQTIEARVQISWLLE